MTGTGNQKPGGPAEALDRIRKHATSPGIRYSPAHRPVLDAVEVWLPIVNLQLMRLGYAEALDPDVRGLEIDQKGREIVWSAARNVYDRRSLPVTLLENASDSDVRQWLQRMAGAWSKVHGVTDSDYDDVRIAHSNVKAMLMNFRIHCPKHIVKNKKRRLCPEFHWIMFQLEAPGPDESVRRSLYEDHEIYGFITFQREQLDMVPEVRPRLVSSSTQDREFTPCALWYIYLIFGQLRRLNEPAAKDDSDENSPPTVLNAIAARFGSIFWASKPLVKSGAFPASGQKYVEDNHADLFHALLPFKPTGQAK